ncbi:MAG: PKD domain-containing protein [Natronomonas sp.]
MGDSLHGSEIIARSQGDIVVSSEAKTSYVLFGSNTSVSRIWFAGDDVDGEVMLLDLAGEPTTTGPSPGRTVSVSSITVPDDVTDRNATIRFAVSTERLDELAVEASHLQVNRYDTETDALTDLETTLVEETQDSVVVEAETPGFSLFSVSAVNLPDAVLSDLPEATDIGTEMTLDASASTDRYGTILRYVWTIGDQKHRGETVTISFDSPGEYTVELTVTNDANESHTVRETILVEAVDTPEPADIDTPSPTPVDDSETEEGDIDSGPDDQAFGLDLLSAVVAFGVVVSVVVIRQR